MEGLTLEYIEYIHSKEWRIICKRIHKRDRVCQGCGTRDHLDVHHKTYKNFKNESDEELILVCRKCHNTIHASHKLNRYGKNLSKTTGKVLERLRMNPLKEVRRVNKKFRRKNRKKDKWAFARKLEKQLQQARLHTKKEYLR